MQLISDLLENLVKNYPAVVKHTKKNTTQAMTCNMYYRETELCECTEEMAELCESVDKIIINTHNCSQWQFLAHMSK